MLFYFLLSTSPLSLILPSLCLSCVQFIGHIFVLVNMVFQLAGCGMILIRKYVYVAVGMLFGIIILQVNLETVHVHTSIRLRIVYMYIFKYVPVLV